MAGVGSRRLTSPSEAETSMAPFCGKKTEAWRREATCLRLCIWGEDGFELTSL